MPTVLALNISSENLLLFTSILVFVAIVINKLGSKFGAPSLLLFLLLGVAVGSDGLGVEFNDYTLAEHVGHFAMTIILFTGGLQTEMREARFVMKQGIVLSSLGVFLFVLITAAFIYFAVPVIPGRGLLPAVCCLMMAAIMGSTDSPSVFSILKSKRINLRENLGPLLELESGSNDPMAYILTILTAQIAAGLSTMGTGSPAPFLVAFGLLVLQVIVGLCMGLAIGTGACWIIEKLQLPSKALYSILILSFAFFASGITELLHGSGLLALYVCAIIIGNRAKIPQKNDVVKFFDGMTWLMQLMMFLMLGLLARPSSMLPLIVPALLIGGFMIFVARPLSVFVSLLPFKSLSVKAKALISWVGLKGAGPILFAIYPLVHGGLLSADVFNIVFLITLLSLLLQGMTLPPVARLLNLCYDSDPEVDTFGIEIPEGMGILRDHIVTEADFRRGKTLRDLSLPHGIRVLMVKRKEKYLVPHGSMELFAGDKLVLIIGESDD